MDKTGIQAATLAFVNQISAGEGTTCGAVRLHRRTPSAPIRAKSDQADIAAALANGLKTIVSFGGITACQNGVEIGQLNGKAGRRRATWFRRPVRRW